MKEKTIKNPDRMLHSTRPASMENQQMRALIRAAMAKKMTAKRLLIQGLLSRLNAGFFIYILYRDLQKTESTQCAKILS